MLTLLPIGGLLLLTMESCAPYNSGLKNGATSSPDAKILSSGRTVTVRPTEIDDILYNPGMGFADFHFEIGVPLSSSQHPRSTIAYIRWSWADLEPAEGQYDFGRERRHFPRLQQPHLSQLPREAHQGLRGAVRGLSRH